MSPLLNRALADEAQELGKLEALQAEMARLHDHLRATGTQRDRLEEELRATELSASALQARIQDAEKNVATVDVELADLHRQRRNLEQKHRRQLEELSKQIAAAYRLGRQEPLKLVFNMENPQSLGRNLRYYDYFVTARRDQLRRYQDTLEELAANQAIIDTKRGDLGAHQQLLVQERAALTVRQGEREKLLAEIDRQLHTDNERLQQLATERKALEAVLAAIEAERQRQLKLERELERERQRELALAQERQRQAEAAAQSAADAATASGANREAADTRADSGLSDGGTPNDEAADTPTDDRITPTAAPFGTQRGLLPWPARATVAHAFGSVRAASLSWQGWLMVGEEGTPVRAIHPGRVVFADYLGGQGLLLIIDHGDGYLSLYAHNQALLKRIGDAVERGEVVARIGNTGGVGRSALYFEIRHGGEAIDPRSWLRSKA